MKNKALNEDLNERAKAIADAATLLGKSGGFKGGLARAAKLTPEQRSAIAKKAANARWKK